MGKSYKSSQEKMNKQHIFMYQNIRMSLKQTTKGPEFVSLKFHHSCRSVDLFFHINIIFMF